MSVATVEQGGPWTLDDWFELNESSSTARYELINGGLLVTPSGSNDHQAAGDELRYILRNAAPKEFRVLTSANVLMSEEGSVSILIPDIAVGYRDATAPRFFPAESVVLAVEVVSPSSKANDRRMKPPLYAAAGILNYWRVELEPFRGQGVDLLPVIFTYVLKSGDYVLTQRIGAGNLVHITDPFEVTFDPARLADY